MKDLSIFIVVLLAALFIILTQVDWGTHRAWEKGSSPIIIDGKVKESSSGLPSFSNQKWVSNSHQNRRVAAKVETSDSISLKQAAPIRQ